MENDDFDWLNGNLGSNYGTPEFLTSGSPAAGTVAEQASPAVDRAGQPSGKHALALLRLSSWRRDKQYDKNNPVCIHYDFKWKISQREKIRARHVCLDIDPDLVLALSDVWKNEFQA